MVSALPIILTVNFGTGRFLLTTPNVALSSNMPFSLHSRRISLGVRTVKRALPKVTTASSSALGLYGWFMTCADKVSDSSKVVITGIIFFMMLSLTNRFSIQS